MSEQGKRLLDLMLEYQRSAEAAEECAVLDGDDKRMAGRRPEVIAEEFETLLSQLCRPAP